MHSDNGKVRKFSKSHSSKTSDEAVRGAAVSLWLSGHTLANIGNEVDLPLSTVHDIVQYSLRNAGENKENTNPLEPVNIRPSKSPGRPVTFSSQQRQTVIYLATKDASNRRKSFKLLARECPFHISNVWLARILREAGYTQHIPRAKPHLTSTNQKKRYIFSTEYKDRPLIGFWDGWIFTDEMYFVVGSHYGPERVIRNKDEEYHPDCVDRERPGDVRLMFWGAIAYNIPCLECPFYIWEEETPDEKAKATMILAEENRKAEEAVKEAKENWYSCQGCCATPGCSQAHNLGHSKECLTAQCNFTAQCKLWLS